MRSHCKCSGRPAQREHGIVVCGLAGDLAAEPGRQLGVGNLIGRLELGNDQPGKRSPEHIDLVDIAGDIDPVAGLGDDVADANARISSASASGTGYSNSSRDKAWPPNFNVSVAVASSAMRMRMERSGPPAR